MFSFDPKNMALAQVHNLLVGGVAPRPIALVSTQSKDGKDNLAPFSFFNAFGANPPMVAFSPARSGRDGKLKDTYRNLVDTKECTIQIVTYDLVEQVNVASGEYLSGVDEFTKSGLTKLKSNLVKPFRVKESPFHMECKLHQMIELGDKNGSGNLAICEVIQFHIAEDLYVDGKVVVEKMNQVGRNGGAYYTRSFAPAMFEIRQPGNHLGIGYDQLPKAFKDSHELSANDLGQLATIQQIPSIEESKDFVKKLAAKDPLATAKAFLKERKTIEAYMVLAGYFQK